MTSRRSFLGSAGALVAGGVASSLLGVRLAHGQKIPAGYAPDYADIVKQGRKEGRCMIYTNMSAPNWQPVIKAFNQRYPDIKVDMLDLGSREAIERYLAEKSTGVATADLIVTASQDGWLDMGKRKEILEYASPEAAAWPAWSKPLGGLYTVSADPLVFAWNNARLPAALRPKTFAQFAGSMEANRATWAKRITSYSPIQGSFGYVIHWFFIQHHGEQAGWKMLQQLARLPVVFESSGGPQLEKVTTGEYVASYFCSGIQLLPRLKDPVVARLIGWGFIGDGQPMMVRGVGVPRGAKNQNAGKLMLDFTLSAEGQQALGLGGVTPARPDVKPSDAVRHTFSSIASAVGEKNIILLGYDPKLVSDYDSFHAKLKKTFSA